MMIVTIGWAIAGIGFSSLLFVVVSGYKNKIQDDIKEYKLITSSGFAAPHKSEQQNSIYREGKIIANNIPKRQRTVSASARELLKEVEEERKREREKQNRTSSRAFAAAEHNMDSKQNVSVSQNKNKEKHEAKGIIEHVKGAQGWISDKMEEDKTDILGSENAGTATLPEGNYLREEENLYKAEEATEVLNILQTMNAKSTVPDGTLERERQTDILKEQDIFEKTDVLEGKNVPENEKTAVLDSMNGAESKTAVLDPLDTVENTHEKTNATDILNQSEEDHEYHSQDIFQGSNYENLLAVFIDNLMDDPSDESKNEATDILMTDEKTDVLCSDEGHGDKRKEQVSTVDNPSKTDVLKEPITAPRSDATEVLLSEDDKTEVLII